MKTYLRLYTYIILVTFIVQVFTAGVGLAFDIDAQQDMLMSEEVIEGLFGYQIGDQSEPGDLDQSIAPTPKIITTSNGDVYIYSGQGAAAQVSLTETGYTEVTYTLNGANVRIKNEETGEEFTYRYELDGMTVNLYNAAGEIVRTSTFDTFGQQQQTLAQGNITYYYKEVDGVSVIDYSEDQWGNITKYDDLGRPDYIYYLDENDQEVRIGDYVFNSQGILETFTDYNGDVTYFQNDGIRPSYTTNAEGTITKTYVYDEDGYLTQVVDEIRQQVTMVEEGYYTVIYDIVDQVDDNGDPIVDDEGNPVQEMVLVGAYSYDSSGYVTCISSLGEERVLTGWTEYNEKGQVSGSYNHAGVKVQEFVYNERGFLQQTYSLGAVSELTGEQEILSITNYDSKGRPFEVWQVGEGDQADLENINTVRVQTYVYKSNGVLDYTLSWGVKRGTDEDDPVTYGKTVDNNGNLATSQADYVYIELSKTEFDTKGRPDKVYAIVRDDNGDIVLDDEGEWVLEKQTSYNYDNRGFLEQTYTYGFGGKMTGKTSFDKYSRPSIGYNSQGSETQLFIYGEDGFLTKSYNKGENGVTTGWTNYDAKGKPSEAYNHTGSLVQKYVYDENGLLVMSYSLSGDEGVNSIIVATYEDELLIAAMWDDDYNTDIMDAINNGTIASLDPEDLMDYVWNNHDSTDPADQDLAKKCALKVIQLYSGGAKGGDQGLLNHVGSAYHMLGQMLEADGDQEGAIAAYKVQASEFDGALALAADGVTWELVTSWSKDRLAQLNGGEGVDTGVVTGYTMFGGDSKPMATYQMYDSDDDPLTDPLATKVQDYVYSYESSYKDSDGVWQTETKFTNFMQRTINYGNNEEVIGYTDFDSYGRQYMSYNEDDQLTQKFTYSGDGFLELTYQYGKDKALTSSTLFDNYSRPLCSFNNYGSASNIPDELIEVLSDGLDPADLDNPDWQPYLRGLTQTFEYGTDGFMEVSKTWGEAVKVQANEVYEFATLLGTTKGDGVYDADFDFDDDGDIDGTDQYLFNQAFAGANDFIAAVTVYDSNYDYDQDGDVDKTDASSFAKTFTDGVKYMPTYTGETTYDKYGKASEVTNSEGVKLQSYVYNDRGFLEMSETWGLSTNAQGEVLDINGVVITDPETQTPGQVKTGYTVFDNKSRPVESYSTFDDGTNGEQSALVQQYVYDQGFLIQTNNFGDLTDGTGPEVSTGYTEFDKYGRQKTTYNEDGEKIAVYHYSSQGFLNQTYNYGSEGAYLGKILFNKQGRPDESYNMYANVSTEKGLTQRFNYNAFGFLESSTSHGEDQTKTGTTYYSGYGKAIRGENENGIVVSSYDYNQRGFMVQTNSLTFVETGDSDDIAVTNTNPDSSEYGTTKYGFYARSGYTTFNERSRPVDTYQCYWDTQGEGEGALVQSYNYTNGFVTSTSNYSKDGADVGTTEFDKYGRQYESYNEFGEKTTKFIYGSQGFLDTTYNYGSEGAYLGKTVFNDLGRPTESYNQKQTKVQSFSYDAFTGLMNQSTTYGEPDPDTDEPTQTGTTIYDEFGKAFEQFNSEGAKVADYEYDSWGFMTKTKSYGQNETYNGYTLFSDTGRAASSWSVYGTEETKVQDFIYNTAAVGDVSDAALVGTEDTGFVSVTINYGNYDGPDQKTIGVTIFNKYGQQEKSLNEFGETTTKYYYSGSGFLNMTYNYGKDNAYSGKTLYNELGRPTESYNERGAKVQAFGYSADGFMIESYTYGDPGSSDVGPLTGTTYYNDYGKQTYSTNSEGSKVAEFQYDARGFMIRTDSIAIDDDGFEVVVGYTTYDAATRPTESYSVYNGYESLSQTFNYDSDSDGSVDTGFVLGTKNYVVNLDFSQPDNVADQIGTEVLYAGETVYNKYGRPYESFNELGSLTQRTYYTGDGFISKSYNYGTDGTKTGILIYNEYGRPTEAQNHTGAKTTEYIYNSRGFLEQTLGFNEGLMVNYTTFDVYSKADESFQLFNYNSGSSGPKGGWQYNSGGDSDNYTVNADGTVSGGGRTSKNTYNSFGSLTQSTNYGREGGEISYINFDSFSRPQEVYNTDSTNPVQVYNYNSQGFLASTTNYAEMKAFNDDGDPNPDGTWDWEETTKTYFNNYGQQTDVYLVKDDGTDGAKQTNYQYSSNGFLTKAQNYVDGSYAGYVEYDASGRQTRQYNLTNEHVADYWYNSSGFMFASTQYN